MISLLSLTNFESHTKEIPTIGREKEILFWPRTLSFTHQAYPDFVHVSAMSLTYTFQRPCT
jgi:hypothetical protein